ncbi:hypothetical protein OF83DRAFT_1180435 [Amylostereum chailletii]|nr:hypothetical protein OF83DRAFT_1180435 [Amylostereum chailletii]
MPPRAAIDLDRYKFSDTVLQQEKALFLALKAFRERGTRTPSSRFWNSLCKMQEDCLDVIGAELSAMGMETYPAFLDTFYHNISDDSEAAVITEKLNNFDMSLYRRDWAGDVGPMWWTEPNMWKKNKKGHASQMSTPAPDNPSFPPPLSTSIPDPAPPTPPAPTAPTAPTANDTTSNNGGRPARGQSGTPPTVQAAVKKGPPAKHVKPEPRHSGAAASTKAKSPTTDPSPAQPPNPQVSAPKKSKPKGTAKRSSTTPSATTPAPTMPTLSSLTPPPPPTPKGPTPPPPPGPPPKSTPQNATDMTGPTLTGQPPTGPTPTGPTPTSTPTNKAPPKDSVPSSTRPQPRIAHADKGQSTQPAVSASLSKLRTSSLPPQISPPSHLKRKADEVGSSLSPDDVDTLLSQGPKHQKLAIPHREVLTEAMLVSALKAVEGSIFDRLAGLLEPQLKAHTEMLASMATTLGRSDPTAISSDLPAPAADIVSDPSLVAPTTDTDVNMVDVTDACLQQLRADVLATVDTMVEAKIKAELDPIRALLEQLSGHLGN